MTNGPALGTGNWALKQSIARRGPNAQCLVDNAQCPVDFGLGSVQSFSPEKTRAQRGRGTPMKLFVEEVSDEMFAQNNVLPSIVGVAPKEQPFGFAQGRLPSRLPGRSLGEGRALQSLLNEMRPWAAGSFGKDAC